jgi:hypothetical protein
MHGISRELRDLHIDNHLRFLSSGEQELIEAAQQRSEKPSAADRWDTFCDVRNLVSGRFSFARELLLAV